MLDSPHSASAAENPHSFSNTPWAFGDRQPTIAELMATKVLIPLSKQGQATSFGDLTNAGFSAQQIGAHFAKAKAIADETVIRQDAADEAGPRLDPWVADADYRTVRIHRGALAIVGRRDPQQVFALLRDNSFTSREIGDLWPQILDEAGRLVAAMALPVDDQVPA